jgi:N-acetylmuramoyl-L-alanine amidase
MKKPFRILAAAAVATAFAFAVPDVKSKKTVTVVLDAAHGGKDFGSAHAGFTEKEIAAAVSGKIQELNQDVEVVFYETRNDDSFVSLEDRVKIINAIKPDLVLSLHTNFEIKGEKAGVELFFSDRNVSSEKSKQYADKLAGAFRAKQYKAEVKAAPFYVLKHSEAPAITLEMGYLSNEADRDYLTTAGGQEAIAQTIIDFAKQIK